MANPGLPQLDTGLFAGGQRWPFTMLRWAANDMRGNSPVRCRPFAVPCLVEQVGSITEEGIREIGYINLFDGDGPEFGAGAAPEILVPCILGDPAIETGQGRIAGFSMRENGLGVPFDKLCAAWNGQKDQDGYTAPTVTAGMQVAATAQE